MGYALVMLGVVLLMVVVITTTDIYGIAKDSQVTPLRAENTYAERETGKAQTHFAIVNTCLAGSGTYATTQNGAGPYTLWLTVRNNGSTVLDPNNFTIFFNLSYYSLAATADVGSSVLFGNVWQPLTNVSISSPDITGKKMSPNITIYDLNYPYRLMMAASNGIKVIAPPAVTNFSGQAIKDNSSYSFNWSAPVSDAGIAYYLLYDVKSPGTCPPSNLQNIFQIPGNITSSNLNYSVTCPDPPCPNTFFYITAVDNNGNMGVQSVTLNCNPPNSGQNCDNKGNPYG